MGKGGAASSGTAHVEHRADSRARRRWALWALALLLVAATSAAATWRALEWLHTERVRSALPTLPDLSGYSSRVQEQIGEADRTVRESFPTSDLVGRLGQTYHANFLYPEAAACYALAEESDPAGVRWTYYRGLIDYEMGRHDRAIEHFQRVVERQPDNPCALLRVADAQLKLDRLPEATEIYRKVLAWPAYQRQTRFGLARVAERRREWSAVVELLAEQVWTGKGLGPDFRLLARAYREMGRPDQADRLNSVGDYFGVGGSVALDDPAVRELEAISCSSTFLLKQARLAMESGDQDRRAKVLARWVEVAPDDPYGQIALCEFHEQAAGKAFSQGRLDDARTLFAKSLENARTAAKLDSRAARPYVLSGIALEQLGRREEAIASLRRAIELDPQLEEPHRLLGIALAKAGQLAEAERVCRRAVELSPLSAPACSACGFVASQAGRWDEAMTWWQRAKEILPLSPIPDYDIARALAAQGKRDEAISLLRATIERWPDWVFARDLLAEIEKGPASSAPRGAGSKRQESPARGAAGAQGEQRRP